MNNLLAKPTLTMILLFAFLPAAFGQEIEMADNFRGEGKIYVVVAVILLILVGIFLYLLRLDKKIDKIEKEQGENL